jgi:hypothetical protein
MSDKKDFEYVIQKFDSMRMVYLVKWGRELGISDIVKVGLTELHNSGENETLELLYEIS